MVKSDENIVKKTCKELGITYKELGKRIGVSKEHIGRLATADNDEIVEQIKRSLEMLLKINELEKKQKDIETFTAVLKKLSK
ncbi:MAG: XRE family transcriptional regulator [Wolinella sp.]